MTEPSEALGGGVINQVVRIGDTVRRPLNAGSPVAHALLRHLCKAGFAGAPRFLGIDEDGREMLSYVPGTVLLGADYAAAGDAALLEAASLIRRYHDAVRGFRLPPGLSWPFNPPFDGPDRLPCHNDLAPRNTIYRDGHAVALVDWDLVTEAPSLWDVAHAVWQYVPLVDDASLEGLGWHCVPDRARRLRLFCEAYGLRDGRDGLLDAVVRRIQATADGIDELARTGAPVFVSLVDQGVPSWCRRHADWVTEHAKALALALSASERSRRD